MRETVTLIAPMLGWAAGGVVAQVVPAAADPGVMTALVNFGGLGMLSAVLFYLHGQARQDAKDDRSAERKAWTEHLHALNQLREQDREEQERRHVELLAAIRDRKGA